MVIPNAMGTAPGIVAEKDGKIVAAFPGPPAEFIPMVDNFLIPYLTRKTAGHPSVIVSRTLRVVGIGESAAEDKIKDLLDSVNPTIAPYAKSGEVHFRITAKAPNAKAAAPMIESLEAKARERLGDFIYGIDEDNLETVIVRMLIERRLTLAMAESCTGGHISNRITNVPGSSHTFLASVVTYSNKAKTDFLDVPAEMIKAHGAVSSEVAEAMALGASARTGADIAVGVTGIAGPDGGTPEKPVGLVYIGLKTPDGITSTRNIYGGGRLQIKERAAQTALNLIRMYLRGARDE